MRFSGYALNLHRLPRELSGVESLFAITTAGTTMLLPAYLIASLVWKTVPVSATSIGAILVQALLVSVFGNLIPVFGTVLAMLFLDERLYRYHLAGGALVALGVYLAAATRRDAPPPMPPQQPGN